MKNKKVLQIITLVMVAALIAYTVISLGANPSPAAADFANGVEDAGYIEAAAAYKLATAMLTIGVLIIGAFMFATEVVPIAITAMLMPIYFALSGIQTFSIAFAGLANSTVVLFGGMFVVGAAMFETGLAITIGTSVVKAASGSENRLLLGVMILTGVMSAFLSNTGTVAVLMPVCIGIADSQGWARSKVLMPLAIMSSAGGMCTMIGTPPNLTVNTVLTANGIEGLGFFGYAWFGAPAVVMTIVYMMLIGNKLVPNRTTTDDGAGDAEEGKVYDKTKQIIAGVILVITIFFLATGLAEIGVVAVTGALVCIITGCISEKEAYRGIDWSTIFLFAGALALANALSSTGAGAIIADNVVSLMGGDPSPYILFTVLFILAGVLTQFMSNTASAALLCPIGLAIADSLGADPIAVVAAIGFSCSAAYMTPIATPPNTLVYGPGGFKFVDYAKVGAPLFMLTYVLAIILIPIIWPFFPAA